jgi:hypothetical protein
MVLETDEMAPLRETSSFQNFELHSSDKTRSYKKIVGMHFNSGRNVWYYLLHLFGSTSSLSEYFWKYWIMVPFIQMKNKFGIQLLFVMKL